MAAITYQLVLTPTNKNRTTEGSMDEWATTTSYQRTGYIEFWSGTDRLVKEVADGGTFGTADFQTALSVLPVVELPET